MGLPGIIVEVAFSAGASTSTWLHLDDTTRGKLDTGTLAPDETWSDVSEWVLAASTQRGARRIESPVIRYEPGTATIVLDNSDRRFDPVNLAGPYVVSGKTQVTPMRAVRIRAIFPNLPPPALAIGYDLFRGFADEWRVTYSEPAYSQVVLTATDAFKVISNIDRAAGSPVGASERSGARVNRILDALSWSATDRDVAIGDSTLQASTLAGNALTELRLVGESELGEVYIDGAGRFVFRNRKAILVNTRSGVSQGTFGDGGGNELPYEDVEIAYDDAQLTNRALISRAGGTQQQADNAASQALYLIRTLTRTDLLLETDGETLDWAGYVVGLASEPELRFATMTIFPRADETNLFPQVLARDLGDRLTVIRRPPGGGAAITRDVFIRGISHDISQVHGWRTVWALESATRYQFFVLDHATLGQLDNNELGF